MLLNNPSQNLKDQVKKAIDISQKIGSDLSDREIFILQKRYGKEVLSLGDLKEIMGLSRQRINQIELKAIRKVNKIYNLMGSG